MKKYISENIHRDKQLFKLVTVLVKSMSLAMNIIFVSMRNLCLGASWSWRVQLSEGNTLLQPVPSQRSVQQCHAS